MTKNRTPTPVYLDPGMHPGLEVKGLRLQYDLQLFNKIYVYAFGHSYTNEITNNKIIFSSDNFALVCYFVNCFCVRLIACTYTVRKHILKLFCIFSRNGDLVYAVREFVFIVCLYVVEISCQDIVTYGAVSQDFYMPYKLDKLEHCLCTITKTSIRPSQDSSMVHVTRP